MGIIPIIIVGFTTLGTQAEALGVTPILLVASSVIYPQYAI